MACHAQSATDGAKPARVLFHQDRLGLEAPHFTIAVDEEGKGSYRAELAPPKSADGDATAPVVERAIAVTPATTAKIFELARAANLFRIDCNSKVKNLADTGAKTLTYAGADGKGECLFNYSEAKPVQGLADIFLSMEATLEAGRRMDFKRRFDRLGLDAEMITLGNMLEAHQASEVAIIAPTLRAIASDTELLQRVRQRAVKMLQQVDEAKR